MNCFQLRQIEIFLLTYFLTPHCTMCIIKGQCIDYCYVAEMCKTAEQRSMSHNVSETQMQYRHSVTVHYRVGPVIPTTKHRQVYQPLLLAFINR